MTSRCSKFPFWFFAVPALWLVLCPRVSSAAEEGEEPNPSGEATVYTTATFQFAKPKTTFTPTFLVMKAPDMETCTGVFYFASHFAMDKAAKGKHSLDKNLEDPNVGGLLRYLREKHNMALIVTNCFRPWRSVGPEINESQQAPGHARILNKLFDEIAGRWSEDMEELCQEFDLPKPGESTWLLGAQSNGSKHMAYLLPSLPAGIFEAAWMHGSTLYRNPSPAMKDLDLLLSVGRNDYGYAGAVDFFAQCRNLGFSRVLFRPDWSGHGASMATASYAQTYYDWVLSGKKFTGEEDAFYADPVNLEIFSGEEKEWIPELQRVRLPNRELADRYLEQPGGERPALVRLENGGDYSWRMTSNAPNQGEWMSSPDWPEDGNVLVLKAQVKRANLEALGSHVGKVIFRDAYVQRVEGQGEPVRRDLEWRIYLSGKRLGLFDSSGAPVIFGHAPRNEDWNEVKAELWYHRERKKVALLANGHLGPVVDAELDFGENHTFGVGENVSDVLFGALNVESREADALFLVYPPDEGTQFLYKLQAAERNKVLAVKWSEQPIPPAESNYTFATDVMVEPGQFGVGGIVLENADDPEDRLLISLYYGPKAVTVVAWGANWHKPIKGVAVKEPREQPIRLSVSYDPAKTIFEVTVGTGKKPTMRLKRPMKIGRVGHGVRPAGIFNFGKLDVVGR